MSAAVATLAKNQYFPPRSGSVSFVVFIALVELLIRVGVINRFIVPLPSDIIAAFPRVSSSRSTCCSASCSPPARPSPPASW